MINLEKFPNVTLDDSKQAQKNECHDNDYVVICPLTPDQFLKQEISTLMEQNWLKQFAK